jgi:AcrR family transcriptional regulator
MEEMPTPQSRRPGRPRSEKARAAILGAALELLDELGLLAMTMEGVAARAGASTATLYRWWDSKELLALDAVDVGMRHGYALPIDTGSLAGDLRASLEGRLRSIMAPRMVRVFAGMMAHAHEDPAFGAAYRARVFEPMRESTREVFRRAVARGEIGADADAEQALDLLFGALAYRLVVGHAPADVAFRHGIVDIVTKGLGAGEGAGDNHA